jgi:microcystin-dependent protein
MAESDTTRLVVHRWSADTDSFSRAELDTSLANIEARAAVFLEGTRAARPAAGITGRFYTVKGDATAALNGNQYYDNGTVWTPVGVPTGAFLDTGAAAAPAGYLPRDGTTVSRTVYADLFAAIGTAFNTGGEVATDFRLPGSAGRFTLAASGGQPRGSVGGAGTVTLTTANLASHAHDYSHNHSASSDAQGVHSHTYNAPYNPGTANVATGSFNYFTQRQATQTTDAGAHGHNIYVDTLFAATGAAGSATPFAIMPPFVSAPGYIKT